MTNEEVKVVLKSLADNPLLSAEHITKALYKAIELVETQPCEDCISREEAIENFASWYGYDYDNQGYYRLLKQLPSVTPKFTDEEIQKIQELEQAQLEKAYELGMQTSFEEWLSTFNTDSATECFVAVQELKKRLEGEE